MTNEEKEKESQLTVADSAWLKAMVKFTESLPAHLDHMKPF